MCPRPRLCWPLLVPVYGPRGRGLREPGPGTCESPGREFVVPEWDGRCPDRMRRLSHLCPDRVLPSSGTVDDFETRADVGAYGHCVAMTADAPAILRPHLRASTGGLGADNLGGRQRHAQGRGRSRPPPRPIWPGQTQGQPGETTYSQAKISHETARCATSAASELVDAFREREWIYRKLVTQSRDVGGFVGSGVLAVAESHDALVRLERRAPNGLDQGSPYTSSVG